VDFSGFKIGFSLHSQVTMGHPTDDRLTSLNNLNLLIQTPLQLY
jgi:hypothetical protein